MLFVGADLSAAAGQIENCWLKAKASDSADNQTWLSDGGVSAMAIPGRLVYFQSEAELWLAWELQVETLDAQHYWGKRSVPQET